MSKTLTEYRDEIRELRSAGLDFPASRGYRLSGPLSSGLKAAITRAYNTLKPFEEEELDEVTEFEGFEEGEFPEFIDQFEDMAFGDYDPYEYLDDYLADDQEQDGYGDEEA